MGLQRYRRTAVGYPACQPAGARSAGQNAGRDAAADAQAAGTDTGDGQGDGGQRSQPGVRGALHAAGYPGLDQLER